MEGHKPKILDYSFIRVHAILHVIVLSFFIHQNLIGQENFYQLLKKENPYDEESKKVEIEEVIALHEEYITIATKSKDTLRQILGHIFLYEDYVKKIKYEEASKQLLKAQVLAEKASNNIWQGWINHKKGGLYVHLRDFESSISYYLKAEEYCSLAKDTICMALSLEQLSSVYGHSKNFDSAHYYFSLAEPLLNSHANDNILSVALINHGSLLVYQDRNKEAIPYYIKASKLCENLADTYRKVQCDNNLAAAYTGLKQFRKAEELFKQCIQTSKENNWPERLFYSYFGISRMYKASGNYKEAMDYFVRFHNTRDTIINNDLKVKVAELESKYKSAEQKRELETIKADLLHEKLSKHRILTAIGVIITILTIGILFYILRNRQSQNLLRTSKVHLRNIAEILAQKNKQLQTQSEELLTLKSQLNKEILNEDRNLYDQRILTFKDWFHFKATFENLWPGFIDKLNHQIPSLTDAELRLFLLLKLKLSTKESAEILGIAVESVKKTRYRLRKRLKLNQDDSLEKFVLQF